MTIDQRVGREHDRVTLLLPWFVNQTLDAEEREIVRAHLDACAECRADVELLADIQSGVREQTATPIIGQPDDSALQAAIDAETGDSAWHLSRVAVAATVAGVAVLLTWLFLAGPGSRSPVVFETATTPVDHVRLSYVLDIGFSPGYPEADRNRLFTDMAAVEVHQADDPARYSVVVQWPAGSGDELQSLADQVLSSPGVESVEVRAVQLPLSIEP